MSDLRRSVEALRQPLLSASANAFGGMDRVSDLGATLRRACERVADVAPAEHARAFRAWRATLAGFERMERDDQEIEVARGLRLCQQVAGRARPARAKRPSPEVDPLGADTHTLPGIGPALAERLSDRSLDTVEDLVWFVPRRYDDVRDVRQLSEVLAADDADGERATAEGIVASCRFNRRGRRRWVDLRLACPSGSGPTLVIRWFNAYGPMSKRFPNGSTVVISGVLQRRGGAFEMANPDVLSIVTPDGRTTEAPARIIPRYSAVPGVPPAKLRKACVAAIERASDRLLDGVPATVAERVSMPPLPEALLTLHAPPEELDVEVVRELNAGRSPWHRRLAFDELFVLGLVVAMRRRDRRADRAEPCPVAPGLDEQLASALPFSLTGAQRRSVDAIRADLAREVPMNRLLQGDVGSGKTAVAFAAAHQVIAAGRQVAMMAPTEILAEQHAGTVTGWCDALGIRCAHLSASTPRGVRASTLTRLAAGEIQLIVGTHSLLSEGVVFDDLGLAIIDEQHRFGVAQRVRLRSKGDGDSPHLLVMTATPIPRTLALTAYGDLDVAVIDELPPGRVPPKTRVLAGQRGRQQAGALLRKRLAAGERAFVVCPLVEPSVDDEVRQAWADATTRASELARILAPVTVGLVHGRMSQLERDRVMSAFRDGTVQVLVATTVIEVGVDVPEATVMIIEDAHHFGLAQLHQLRGRVGRGALRQAQDARAECLLLTRGRLTPAGKRRLEVMAETTDGFRIAEEDLQIRGPGELLGARQAGLPRLRFGDLRQHAELLVKARAEAERVLESDPDLEHPDHAVTRRVLDLRMANVEAYGPESG